MIEYFGAAKKEKGQMEGWGPVPSRKWVQHRSTMLGEKIFS